MVPLTRRYAMMLRSDAVVDYQDEGCAVIRHDARDLPLEDGSVDLIVTSPPYFALRSYRDDGEHYDGQIGSEDTPDLWLDALDECMVEWRRVLKPSGSVWINLGDKYAGTGGANSNTGLGLEDGDEKLHDNRGSARNNTKQTNQYRAKSLLGLPWRFAIRQIDNGWILRAEVIWDKPNGLPESVTDRVRRSHEQWFHFVKEPRYFSGVDEIREPQSEPWRSTGELENRGTRNADSDDPGVSKALQGLTPREYNPLGRLPGSVWSIPDGRDMVVVTLEAWRSANGLCPTCGKIQRQAVGNGQDGETAEATAKAPATSSPAPKTGRTESPTDSSSDQSPTDSPSTISAETEGALTPITSKRSPSKSTSAAARKPTEPVASTVTASPTPTSTEAAATDAGNAEPATSDVCGCDNSGSPGSVWTVPSEPLLVPDAARDLYDLPDHFAAFSQEFPRRIISGWSPTGICTVCGEGRRPVVEATPEYQTMKDEANWVSGTSQGIGKHRKTNPMSAEMVLQGYACACPTSDAPTRPSLIVDPFGGTGTVAGVAKTLGRFGISNDLSASYNRLAVWRITQSGHFSKTEQRAWADRQGSLL